MRKSIQNKGFTLLEILLVIGAIGILAAIVLVAINPNRQLEAARNAKRRSDINTIQKAIQQYSIDNNGQYPAGIETGAKAICRGGTPVGCIDLSILAPTYIASIPEPDSNYYYVRRSNNNIEVSHPRDNIWNIGGTPSLDLNFARNKSLIDSVSGKNLIDFTRNSTATYVGEDGLIKTAGVNEPRFDHDPVTGESLGLLVEESRSNLITITTNNENGSPITDFNYPMNGFDENNTQLDIAPDGNLVLCKYNMSAQTNNPFLSITSTAPITAGLTYTMSMWVKGESNYSASFAWANQTTSEVPNTMIEITPEWKRYSFTFTPQFNATSWRLQIFFASQGNNKTISVWGAQLEQGSFATSYIPRPSGQSIRNADNAVIQGTKFTEWFNFNQGTFLVNGNWTYPNNQNINYPKLSFGAGGQGSFDYFITFSDFPRFSYFPTTGGEIINDPQGSTQLTSQRNDSALSYSTVAGFASMVSSINGNTPVTTIPSTLILNTSANNILRIGKSINVGPNELNGNISRISYYPKQLTNNQLINLTK